MPSTDAIAQALGALNEKEAKSLIDQHLEAGTPPTEILEACRKGLAEVGERFNRGEYFISELMYAGEVMKDISARLQPLLGAAPELKGEGGHIVIGTVQGDIHDIGKDIVVLMLRGAGYTVTDLGVDVAPARFVQAVQDQGAFLVGMSVFLTTCCKAVERTVVELKSAGLRDRVGVIIGGAAASQMVAQRTGCDGYGATAVDAVALAAEAKKRLAG